MAKNSWTALIAAFLLPVALGAVAERENLAESMRARHKRQTEAMDKEHALRYADDPDVLVKPALLADRRSKTVRLWAETTAPEFPVEYYLVGERSGRDYESLAVSLARPLHVHEGLEFIGLPPGQPVNYEQNRLWPKGERVHMTFIWNEKDEKGRMIERRERAERLLVDTRTNETLPETGLIFTGSYRLPPSELPGGTAELGDDGDAPVYVADVFEPFSIASNYNEPTTILDVPESIQKGEIYEFLEVNPDIMLPYPALVEVLIEPRHTDLRPRVKEVWIEATSRPGRSGQRLGDLLFKVRLAGEPKIREDYHLTQLLAYFNRLTGDGGDLFLSIAPDPSLPLSGVYELYRFLDGITGERGVRIEPAPEGHLFYRAFLPLPSLRRRQDRTSQPWEMHFKEADGYTGKLVQLEWLWEPGAEEAEPRVKAVNHTFRSPQDARNILDKEGPGAPWIVAYAGADMTYTRLLEYSLLLLETHRTFYVFLDVEAD